MPARQGPTTGPKSAVPSIRALKTALLPLESCADGRCCGVGGGYFEGETGRGGGGSDAEGLAVAAFGEEMDVDAQGAILDETLDGERVEHHVEITEGVDVTVEVDVAVNHTMLGDGNGGDGAETSGTLGGRGGVDHGGGVELAAGGKVEGTALFQVEETPLCDGAAELATPGVVEGEVARGEQTVVVADPGGDRKLRELLGTTVEFEGHAGEDPGDVVGAQGVDAEAFGLGVDAGDAEDDVGERGHRGAQGKVHHLGVDFIRIGGFLSHKGRDLSNKDSVFARVLQGDSKQHIVIR